MRSVIVLLLLGFGLVAYSQTERLIKIDDDGYFKVGTRTLVARHNLAPGMYRAHLVNINGRSVAVFSSVVMSRIGKNMWPRVRSELFRIEVQRSRYRMKRNSATIRVVRDRDNKQQLALEITFGWGSSHYVLPVAVAGCEVLCC